MKKKIFNENFTILVKESALVLLQTAPMHIEVAELQKRLVEEVNCENSLDIIHLSIDFHEHRSQEFWPSMNFMFGN